MKRFAILLIVMFSGLLQLKAQPINFGDSTIVSLITCDPGDEIYAKFGHTAIRIKDTEGTDLVYNYGLFDFRTEHFYWKFLRGHTDYLLGVSRTVDFLNEYISRNSSVFEQVLNLNKEEKLKLIHLLDVNYQPQNRTYRYNFIFDNCATRPQDIILEAITGVIVDHKNTTDETYRDIIEKYLKNDAWADLGINILLGIDADKLAGEQGEIFIPGNLKSFFQRATILSFDNGNNERRLVKSAEILVQSIPSQTTKTHWLFHPFSFTMVWLVLGIILTFLKEKKSSVYRVFDTILYFFTGIAGLIIMFFSFFSEHPMVSDNLNLLWLNPLNLVVAFMIWHSKTRKLLFFYNMIYLLLILTYVILNVFFVHSIVPAVIPLIALVFLRTLRREERLLHILITPTSDGLKWKK
jgi:hypothetical protein